MLGGPRRVPRLGVVVGQVELGQVVAGVGLVRRQEVAFSLPQELHPLTLKKSMRFRHALQVCLTMTVLSLE